MEIGESFRTEIDKAVVPFVESPPEFEAPKNGAAVIPVVLRAKVRFGSLVPGSGVGIAGPAHVNVAV